MSISGLRSIREQKPYHYDGGDRQPGKKVQQVQSPV